MGRTETEKNALVLASGCISPSGRRFSVHNRAVYPIVGSNPAAPTTLRRLLWQLFVHIANHQSVLLMNIVRNVIEKSMIIALTLTHQETTMILLQAMITIVRITILAHRQIMSRTILETNSLLALV